MTRARIAAIAGAVAAVAVVAVLGVTLHQVNGARGRDDAAAATTAPASAGTANRTGAVTVPKFPEVAVPAALPGSLDGSQPDGALEADAGGHLIVTIELRRLFDYFLAATGEEPLATMRARIIAALRAKLPRTAAAEAIDILDHYLGYRDAARDLAPALDKHDVLAELDRMHDLRARWFTAPVRDAFFGDEEAALRNAVARRDVLQDKSLTEADRQAKLAALEAQLPAADRAARAAATAPIDQMARDAQLRARGASDTEIAAAREATLGRDAAERLAALDQAHAQWDGRIAAFRSARAAVLADPALTDDERQAKVAALLASSFTSQEQLRVAAIVH